MNEVLSEPQPIYLGVPQGVPQGSVIGHLLFFLPTRLWLFEDVASTFKLYADDTLIFFASKSVSEIQTQLTSGLTNVLSWLRANFIILNLGKAKIMLVGTHQRTTAAEDLVIDISNTRLQLQISWGPPRPHPILEGPCIVCCQ